MVDYLKLMFRMPDIEEKYPALKKVRDNVYSIPKVKAYADTAPPTKHWDDKKRERNLWLCIISCL